MNNTDKEYFRLLNTILGKGRVKHNRTGVDTIGVFGEQAKFDLSEGFPILTTKKVWFKGIVHELLWFIRGDTNIKYLVDNDVHIWDDWRQPYDHQRPLVLIEKRYKEYQPYYGDFSWNGFGISGAIDCKLAYIWEKMMRRCYDKNHHRFSMYGAEGVSVAIEWHNPKTFVEQVKKIPHWFYKEKHWNDFELDKDYYGAKQYGPTTSVWLDKHENNFYTIAAKPVQVIDKDGNKTVFLTGNDAAKKIGISKSSFNRFLNDGFPEIIKGNNRNFIGWEFKELNLEDKLLRLELIQDGELGFVYGRAWRNFEGVDQLKNVIEKLKTNPDDRRMIVSAWHPYWVDHCALPPCHCLFHFNTEELTIEERRALVPQSELDGNEENGFISVQREKLSEDSLEQLAIPTRRLNLLLYQRSCDTALGIPYNISSYSLLLCMVAQCVNMVPGIFTHTYGDLHIYQPHIENLKLQMARESYPLPKLWLNPDVKDLFSFKYEDIKLIDYKSHPKLEFEVAV